MGDKIEIRGRAWKYGDNINTDEIIPARYLNTINPDELAKHCMEDLDTKFAGSVKPGEILVAGNNFGCGSSREHAPIAIMAVGISCIISKSFARIFFRNSINIGLPIIESLEAVDEIGERDTIIVDISEGKIINETKSHEYRIIPYPPFMQELIQKGGLMNYIKEKGRRSF